MNRFKNWSLKENPQSLSNFHAIFKKDCLMSYIFLPSFIRIRQKLWISLKANFWTCSVFYSDFTIPMFEWFLIFFSFKLFHNSSFMKISFQAITHVFRVKDGIRKKQLFETQVRFCSLRFYHKKDIHFVLICGFSQMSLSSGSIRNSNWWVPKCQFKSKTPNF